MTVAFWLVVGVVSVFFAEVLSWSSPFAYVTAWGLVGVLPLYTVHCAFFATLVYRGSGTLRFYPLFAAGTLFGLYEAYVTKVLWAPTWDPVPFTVGGVHVLEAAMLVLLWHPLVAFVLPLAVAERLLTVSRLVAADPPAWVARPLAGRRRAAFGLACVVLASFHGAVAADPVAVLAADALGLGVVWGSVLTWRRRVGVRYPLPALVPGRRGFAVVALLLVAQYAVLVPLLRPSALPPLQGQATVWFLYLALGALLLASLRRSRLTGDRAEASSPGQLRDAATASVALLLVAPAAGLLLAPVRVVAFGGLLAVAILVGPALVVATAVDATGAAIPGRRRS